MDATKVQLLQLWKRQNGVVYEVADERNNRGTRDVLLVPVDCPPGIKARRTWKHNAAVQAEFEFVG